MNIYLTILSLASMVFPFYPAAYLRRETSAAETIITQTEKTPVFVLQVGISDYKYQKKLSGVNDVLQMRKLLTGERYNIPADNILTLCDAGTVKECGEKGGAATKANIVAKFNEHLIDNARKYKEKTGGQAIVVFEFSGHGSQAPDQPNGDETDDHKDETFVTWDSQDAPGKNFDISDDEIYALTKKLSRFTNNIVYILDSCHSGSGTRGADDVRSVAARKNPVVPLREIGSGARGEKDLERKTAPDDNGTDLLPPSKNYIVISAARSGQLAQQKDVFECDTCPKSKKIGSLGFLTYYLMEELRNATETTSYRDVMENVRQKVSAERPTQTPQIEGERDRIVFNNLNKVKDAGIVISDVKGKRIFLEAGAMQGLSQGTRLDVYGVKDEKIATAKVVEVVADKAIAEVVEIKSAAGEVSSPTREISAKDRDRAILIAPDLGAARIKFLPDGDDAAKLSNEDKKVIAKLREKFKPDGGRPDARGVDLTAGKWNDALARWDVALLKDRFDKVFADKTRAAPIEKKNQSSNGEIEYEEFPSNEKQVFYLAGKDFVPLYGFYAEADDKDAAERIERAVVQIARLRSTRAIANNKSRLKNTIVARPFSFKIDDAAPCDNKGNIRMLEKKFLKSEGIAKLYKLNIGEVFGVEITNTSDVPLYIAVLDISTDASVSILSPLDILPESEKGVLLEAKTGRIILRADKCEANSPPVFEAVAPSGVETFKVIAATRLLKRSDFEFLKMGGINSKGDSPLSLESLSDWTTTDVDFEISSTQTKPQ